MVDEVFFEKLKKPKIKNIKIEKRDGKYSISQFLRFQRTSEQIQNLLKSVTLHSGFGQAFGSFGWLIFSKL